MNKEQFVLIMYMPGLHISLKGRSRLKSMNIIKGALITFAIKMPVLTRLRNISSLLGWKHYIEETCNWCTHKSRTAWRRKRKPAKKSHYTEQLVNKTSLRKCEQLSHKIELSKSSLSQLKQLSCFDRFWWLLLQHRSFAALLSATVQTWTGKPEVNCSI